MKVEMGPDLTRAYFWPTVNKRPNRLWPRYFLTQPRRDFLTRKEKIEKFNILRENFLSPNTIHNWLTWPELLKIDPTWPESKFLAQTHHQYSGNSKFLRKDGVTMQHCHDIWLGICGLVFKSKHLQKPLTPGCRKFPPKNYSSQGYNFFRKEKIYMFSIHL